MNVDVILAWGDLGPAPRAGSHPEDSTTRRPHRSTPPRAHPPPTPNVDMSSHCKTGWVGGFLQFRPHVLTSVRLSASQAANRACSSAIAPAPAARPPELAHTQRDLANPKRGPNQFICAMRPYSLLSAIHIARLHTHSHPFTRRYILIHFHLTSLREVMSLRPIASKGRSQDR